MDYTLRDGCEAPVQPRIPVSAQKHPLYGKYLTYRAAMSRQLVSCPSFEDWVERQQHDDWDF